MAARPAIDGATRLIGLLGSPVAHSKSPAIHNAAFAATGVNAAYLAFEVAPEKLAAAAAGLVALGAAGWNVTMPHKTAMAALCDELSPAARIVGAVNTVVVQDGRMTGHITDGSGFTAALTDRGFNPAGKQVALFGAGGAARAAAVQLALDGAAQLVIFNRTVAKARMLAETIAAETGCAARAYALDDVEALRAAVTEADLVINGTKLGMAPHPETCVLPDARWLARRPVVADFVYNPVQTRLLAMAAKAGCPTLDGLAMLLWQGAQAFALWTGRPMPVAAVRAQVFGA
ncbi:shikimate dehydrogenase [Pseudoramibacter alactolyticus]|uniref:shikimate dehydrogenase n=1 Tax=Pseudoramibacter alactolyticus TaxID=113287 RepID=UPI00248F2DB5|nr:shikimate dehydrogenase [Pseudoramibacter alactolyticus]